MNIDILHYAAPPVVGGVESVIAQHARLMADAGHRVRILAGRGEQFDERISFLAIPEADSRHPEIESIKSRLDQGNVPPGFHDQVRLMVDNLAQICENTQVLIAHNVCSLNKNLVLTAALRQLHDYEAHTSSNLVASRPGLDLHHATAPSCTKAIPGICCAAIGRLLSRLSSPSCGERSWRN